MKYRCCNQGCLYKYNLQAQYPCRFCVSGELFKNKKEAQVEALKMVVEYKQSLNKMCETCMYKDVDDISHPCCDCNISDVKYVEQISVESIEK